MKLTGCNGRELASFDQQIPFFEGHISREDTITQEREIQVVELRASHLDIVTDFTERTHPISTKGPT